MITEDTTTQDGFESHDSSRTIRWSGDVEIDEIHFHTFDDGDVAGPRFIGTDETGATVVVWPISKRVRRSENGGPFEHVGYIDEFEVGR